LASWALRAECCTSSWWCRRDLEDGSSERQGAQLSTAPSGPGVCVDVYGRCCGSIVAKKL